MKKGLIKATLAVVLSNALAYGLYVFLLIIEVLSYAMPIESENYQVNMPISIFFFIAPLVILFLIGSVIEVDKPFVIILSVEVLILGFIGITLNVIGASDIMLWLKNDVFHISGDKDIIKYIAPFVSVLFHIATVLLSKPFRKGKERFF